MRPEELPDDSNKEDGLAPLLQLGGKPDESTKEDGTTKSEEDEKKIEEEKILILDTSTSQLASGHFY